MIILATVETPNRLFRTPRTGRLEFLAPLGVPDLND